MGLVNEFVSYVESGFGFIYQEDVRKYYEHLFEETLTEDENEELLDDLREKKLLKDGNSIQERS